MMLSSGPGLNMARRLWRPATISVVLALIILSIYSAMAAQPGNAAFQRTWQRTDKPVLDGGAARTWMWGPEANTDIIQEPYAEAPDGIREVQYFDKARMEITSPDADASSIWYVTNGLLVVELMTGDMQIGNADFEHRNPATVNVAGDADDPTGPTYQTFNGLLGAAPLAPGTTISQRVDRGGVVTDDPALATKGVGVAVIDDVTQHAIAEPFWEFMNSSGTVYEDGQFINSQLFENPYFATGRPITEAYWANVKVAETYRDVLMQCFERRCLTYTPGNPDGFVVEAGNVGQHYYAWRYAQQPGDPTPTTTVTASASASETVTASPTTTSTSIATATMTASPTASPTATTTETVVPEYEYASQWGTQYTTFTSIKAPVDVAIDGAGNLWVVDTHNHRLIEYDENGVFIRTLGSEGTGPGQFKSPVDATFSDDGRLFVADQGNHRIQVFSAEGTFLKEWGSLGTANGQFDAPSGVLVQGQTLYVVDLNNGRIQTFNLEGTYLGQFGAGYLDYPAQLAIAPSGMMYITDYQTHVIREYNPSTTNWTFFGDEGTGTRQFKNPAGIAIDADGYIYISESGNSRVQVLNPNTSYNSEWGTQGYGFGQFFAPRDLVVDGKGNLYIADYGNNRIQKFTTDGRVPLRGPRCQPRAIRQRLRYRARPERQSAHRRPQQSLLRLRFDHPLHSGGHPARCSEPEQTRARSVRSACRSRGQPD